MDEWFERMDVRGCAIPGGQLRALFLEPPEERGHASRRAQIAPTAVRRGSCVGRELRQPQPIASGEHCGPNFLSRCRHGVSSRPRSDTSAEAARTRRSAGPASYFFGGGSLTCTTWPPTILSHVPFGT